MDDALRVRERKAVGDLDRDTDRFARVERTGALDLLLQRSAGEVLHDDERRAIDLAHVVDGDDVRVGELRQSARFLDEHPAGIAVSGRGRIEHLQRDVAVQCLVAGEVDLRRAAHTERLLDLVSAL